jgi:16S rRNA (guanine966-N2)-methyltransferase
MYIIGGKYKRRKLIRTGSKELRPTKQCVREAVFNILQYDIEDALFLDLCSGTGAIGIEALSRGAKEVAFVDIDTRNINKNIEAIGLEDVKVVKQDSLRFIKKSKKDNKKFDIIYFDPPWHNQKLYENTLNEIFCSDILNSQGYFVCEHHKSCAICENKSMKSRCFVWKEFFYGDTTLTIYR